MEVSPVSNGSKWVNPWPDTGGARPPSGHPYRSATWLLGRHDRLARLASRIAPLVTPGTDDPGGEPSFDLDHLGALFEGIAVYDAAWKQYEAAHREPSDDAEWTQWQEAGPKADDVVTGLHDLLVMSSGEFACLLLLATFSPAKIPFNIDSLRSMDAVGQQILADWCEAVRSY